MILVILSLDLIKKNLVIINMLFGKLLLKGSLKKDINIWKIFGLTMIYKILVVIDYL